MSKPSPTVSLKRGSREWKLLSFLSEIGELIIDSSLPPQYPEARLWRSVLGLDKKKRFSDEEKAYLRAAIARTLYRLHAKGLLYKQGKTRRVKWGMKSSTKELLKPNVTDLPPEDGKMRIVIFDIAERQRGSRDWLRLELINAGYSLLQKSVWLGKRPLSDEFYKDLVARNLFESVHIFTVDEEGTLRNIQLPDTIR